MWSARRTRASSISSWPGVAQPFARSEDRHDLVGEADARVEKSPVAEILAEGDARFDEVPGAVHLVELVQVLPASFGMVELEVGIEVAVGHLRRDDEVDRLVEKPPQRPFPEGRGQG